jgi:hypothetical protein
MKINIGDVVRINWQDHYSHANSWQDFSKVKDSTLSEIICSSVGLVIAQDKTQVVLAQNWHPSDNNDTRVADFMVIIKGCIKSVRVLLKKELK